MQHQKASEEEIRAAVAALETSNDRLAALTAASAGPLAELVSTLTGRSSVAADTATDALAGAAVTLKYEQQRRRSAEEAAAQANSARDTALQKLAAGESLLADKEESIALMSAEAVKVQEQSKRDAGRRAAYENQLDEADEALADAESKTAAAVAALTTSNDRLAALTTVSAEPLAELAMAEKDMMEEVKRELTEVTRERDLAVQRELVALAALKNFASYGVGDAGLPAQASEAPAAADLEMRRVHEERVAGLEAELEAEQTLRRRSARSAGT